MTEIYLVEASSGSYDDYDEWIEKAFFNRLDAEEYCKKFNLKLQDKRKQQEVCHRCFINDIRFEKQFNNKTPSIDSQKKIKDKAKEECPNSDIKFSDFGTIWCEYEISYGVIDQHNAKVKTLEVY